MKIVKLAHARPGQFKDDAIKAGRRRRADFLMFNGNFYRLRCPTHPRYLAKREPRADCPFCDDIYFRYPLETSELVRA